MLTNSQKKYLFAIYILGQDGKPVKSTSVADFLGVSKASTVKMTQRLIDEKYIIKEPYREIRLTPQGIKAANELFTPSVILQNFLQNKVGVSEENAREDSITIASQVSREALEKLVQYSLAISAN
ncbi:MAG: metal-dependent transcriptional regulator [Ruminococcus sp.]|nr:metal-dependent transcriptional regulator [Ruminococcus sp.]